MGLSVLALVSLLTSMGATGPAAPPGALSLDVRRSSTAADCPDSDELRSSVTELGGVGHEQQSPTAPVEAKVAFDRVEGRYQAQIQLSGGQEGTRTLTDAGPTCAALARAVAIALTLLLDVAAPTGTPPAANPTLPPPAGAWRDAVPARGQPALTSAFLSLRGGPAWGFVGQASSWAGGLEFGLRLGRRASVLLGGEQVVSRTADLPPGSVTVSLRTAHLAACGLLNALSAWWQLELCALGAAGTLRGEGQGFPTSNGAAIPWLAAGGELRASALFHERWLLAVAAEVEAPLHAYTFSVAQVGKVDGSRRFAGQLFLGVGARLW